MGGYLVYVASGLKFCFSFFSSHIHRVALRRVESTFISQLSIEALVHSSYVRKSSKVNSGKGEK